MQEYGSQIPPWYNGQCPLLEKDRVVIAPVGKKALMAALDKANGRHPGSATRSRLVMRPREIELALELAVERRPKRAASASAFLNEEWPAVLAGVRSREAEHAAAAMDRLRTACMKCHVSEQVPFFTVRAPGRRLTAIRPSDDAFGAAREEAQR